MLIAVLFSLTFAPQMAFAQNTQTVTSMISCLDEAPMPSVGKAADAYDVCVSDVLSECMLIDPPGTVGEGAYTSEKCFLSAVHQIKSAMSLKLRLSWPDKDSLGYQLRKLSIDYAVKSAELKCAFQRAIAASHGKLQPGGPDKFETNSLNRMQSLCLTSHLAADYWSVLVHDQLPK